MDLPNSSEVSHREREREERSWVTIAIPKGRVLPTLIPYLQALGVDPALIEENSRVLVRSDEEKRLRFLLLKPDDVPTYVEYGAADLGVVGRDVLEEYRYDLYVPLDLGIGRCQLVVAAPKRATVGRATGQVLRVATKFPTLAAAHFSALGCPFETIFVQGSVELAPLMGLADVIVDLVQSGETLRQHDLEVRELIMDVTSVVVANRIGFKLKHSRIQPLLDQLKSAVVSTQCGN